MMYKGEVMMYEREIIEESFEVLPMARK